MSQKTPEEALMRELREAVRTARYWHERPTTDEALRALELQHLYANTVAADYMVKVLVEMPIPDDKRHEIGKQVDELLTELRTYSDFIRTKTAAEYVRRILKEGTKQ